MPRNPTEAQREASRRNGARSRGPATGDGWERALANLTGPKTGEGRAHVRRAATGPRTEAGKWVSSANAVKHGILARPVLPPHVAARLDEYEDPRSFSWTQHQGVPRSVLFPDWRESFKRQKLSRRLAVFGENHAKTCEFRDLEGKNSKRTHEPENLKTGPKKAATAKEFRP